MYYNIAINQNKCYPLNYKMNYVLIMIKMYMINIFLITVLGVNEVLYHKQYMRLPTEFKQDKSELFPGISGARQLGGWNERVLSKADKELYY